MDEVSGARLDSTANNHDLSDNGSVLYETGKVNRSALFVAANSEFLSIADHADLSLNGTSWTIMFWAKVSDLAYQPIISKRSSTGVSPVGAEFTIWHYPQVKSIGQIHSNWVFSTDAGNGFYVPLGSGIPDDSPEDSYQFGCFTFSDPAIDGWNYRGYHTETSNFTGVKTLEVRGGLLSISISDGSNPLRIGTSNGTADFMNGGVDEVAIWERALTYGEVRQLWNYGGGLAYPWSSTLGSDLDWNSTGSLETLHRRHRTPDRTHPVFVKYDYTWAGFLDDKLRDVPDVTDWGSPPEVPVLPREHRRAPYLAYSQEDGNIYPDVSDWWLQASEPVMPRKGTGERAYWASGMDRDSASGEPSIPINDPGASSTGGGDSDIIPPTAEPSIDGKVGLYIPERPDLEEKLRPRVDDPE
jgi:hypothetical protein